MHIIFGPLIPRRISMNIIPYICMLMFFFVASTAVWAAPNNPELSKKESTKESSNQPQVPDSLSEWLNTRTAPTNEPSVVQNIRDKASDMVVTAMNFLGVPYKFGGNNEETGFDCSGFTRYIFQNSLGLVLPRRAAEQARMASLKEININELKPGDLVFFNTMKAAFSHVGIYIGDNRFIHSPRSGAVVRIEDMNQRYWKERFDGARRAPGVNLSQESLSQLTSGVLTLTTSPQTPPSQEPKESPQ